MNAIIQYQHIHALLGLVLLHELEQFPVKITKIHHIDRLIVRREQRDHAVRIGILDHKKRLARVIAGMNLYKGMIIIQENPYWFLVSRYSGAYRESAVSAKS